jgi:conjugal transfer pilus assembly protein TraF
MRVMLGLFLFAFINSVAIAASPEKYHHQHDQGWHWYQDPPVDAKKQAEKNPTVHMKSLRETLQLSLDKAILTPSPDNVRNYVTLQNTFSERASRFSNVWQQVLLENPALNYSLTHPTNSAGNEVYLNQKREQEDAAIAQLGKKQGLFFFYTASCPYCQKFAPILKQFAARHKLAIIPITMDGNVLPEFPESVIDKGQAKHFQVRGIPAVFSVNPYSGQAYPVSYGLVSESELRTNMLNIMTQFGRNAT